MDNLHDLSQGHQDAVKSMLPQLLIALIKRSGGKLDIPASEIDDTGGVVLTMFVDDKSVFHFEVKGKH